MLCFYDKVFINDFKLCNVFENFYLPTHVTFGNKLHYDDIDLCLFKHMFFIISFNA